MIGRQTDRQTDTQTDRQVSRCGSKTVAVFGRAGAFLRPIPPHIDQSVAKPDLSSHCWLPVRHPWTSIKRENCIILVKRCVDWVTYGARYTTLCVGHVVDGFVVRRSALSHRHWFTELFVTQPYACRGVNKLRPFADVSLTNRIKFRRCVWALDTVYYSLPPRPPIYIHRQSRPPRLEYIYIYINIYVCIYSRRGGRDWRCKQDASARV